MKGFRELHSLKEIDRFIETNTYAFVYVYQENCSVCHAVQPQAQRILKDFPKIQSIQADASALPELAGRFSIFTVPVLLLFVEGKEVMRFARFVEMDKLHHQLKRITEAFESSDDIQLPLKDKPFSSDSI